MLLPRKCPASELYPTGLWSGLRAQQDRTREDSGTTAMTDDAFVRAILAAPEDDALRSVYADWLEESGDAARAEYLRLLCRLSGDPAPEADALPPMLGRLDELR